MTQEDKELLLKDLSARSQYRVYIRHGINGKSILTGIEYKQSLKRWIIIAEGPGFYLDDIKPYLRPMSSMTEEEKKEYKALCIEETFTFGTWQKVKWYDTWKSIDWLNEHHFDYRGLIEKGFALKAPEGMYK